MHAAFGEGPAMRSNIRFIVFIISGLFFRAVE
jgi:hypothetical protein